jgi:L-iditol 2-dehydrogenase
MLEPLGVALHAVNLAHLKPGDTVAVLGAGPIGLLTAAVARVSGARTVWMTEPLAYRRDFAEETVADAAIDPDGPEGIQAILRLSGGRGVDVVFESAGAPETPQHAVQLARFGGKVILTAIPADDTITFPASIARRKGLTIKMVRRMKHTYPRAISLVERGVVDVSTLITHRLPLSQTGKAMDLISGYQDQVIKAMITF